MSTAYDHIELEPEIMDLLGGGTEETDSEAEAQRLQALSHVFTKERDEDIAYRQTSGVESTWQACEEAYAGIDDSNRHEFIGSRWYKPMTSDAPVITDANKNTEPRSNAFVLLTARYVDAAAAKDSEIMFPDDDKVFTFKPTPVPDVVMAVNDMRQVVHNGVPLQRDATHHEGLHLAGTPPPPNELDPAATAQPPVPATPGQQPGVPLTMSDLAKEAMDQAQESAEKAQEYIADWLLKSHYPREMRKVSHDSARIGVGVLKGPFPKVHKSMACRKVTDPNDPKSVTYAVEMVSKIIPSYEHKDPWNIYPDKNCGESIQNGDHCYERDLFSRSQLHALAGEPGYIKEQIDLAIQEGPGKKYALAGRNPHTDENDERYEVWFRYGLITGQDLETINLASNKSRKVDPKPGETKDAFAIVTMVNDRVIRGVLHHLDTGRLPYHARPWRRRAGSWTGAGVGEQVALPQRAVNGGVRAYLDNAGLSSGIQLIIDTEAIEPGDGVWSLARNKIWKKRIGGSLDDVRKAIVAIEIPNIGEHLERLMASFYKMAEELCSVPLVSQGQSSPSAPDTFGAVALQDNNANQIMRERAKACDEDIKKPVIEQSYEMLLMDPDVPDDLKGVFTIHVSSTVALVELAQHNQFLMQVMPSVTTAANIYRINPAKLFAVIAKAKKVNPVEIQYTDPEWEKISQQPPVKPPAVQVAEIKAQSDTAKVQADSQIEQLRIQSERESMMEELRVRERIEMMIYANKHQISLEHLKTELASTTMKLQTQKELSVASMRVDLHKHKTGQEMDLHKHMTPEALPPPTEPAGKAPNGEAWQE